MSARTLTARSLVSLGTLFLIFLIGLGYVLIGVVQINPLAHPISVTVLMPRSGGLLETSPVSYRGFPVGRVKSIGLRPGGVRVVVELDQGTQIPTNTEVDVADLSAAGEQYLDFKPRANSGPYLADGAVINPADTSQPIPFGTVVTDAANLVGEIDPAKINTVATEAEKAFNNSAPDLQQVLDGGNYLLTGLQGVLPQTIDVLHNGRILLGTVYDLRGQIGQLAPAALDLTGRLRRADPTIADLLDATPRTLGTVDREIRRVGPPLQDTLNNAGQFTQVLADRLPALSLFLPGLISLGPTVKSIVHGNQLQVIGDAYPRLNCDYGTPRRPPNLGGHLPAHIFEYCPTQRPRLLQRGAAVVPRPPGDRTDRAPQGVDRNERARLPQHPGSR